MDLAFGTAALNLNTEANQGVAEAINDSGRLDHVLLERLLTRCGDHLGLLAAPAVLEKAYDLELQTLEPLLEVAQSTVPYTILDLPHAWSSWSKGVLGAVDDIVIVATPDLASLRNAKNLLTVLKQIRPHDPAPKVVLNQVGVPKRPEIKPSDFADALQIKLTACIAFNAQLFGNAAIKGQMIAQAQKKGDAVIAIAEITRTIAGRRNTRRSSALSGKNSLIRKLLGSRATS
jgi:pilus assembly protein CpaE